MDLYALQNVDDAIEATREFLLPFDRVRWLRLAVVMFFVAGAGFSMPFPPTGGFGGGFDTGDWDTGESGPSGPDDVTIDIEWTAELVALIVGLIVLIVALWLLYSIVGATMEFVFVSSLRDEEVRLRRGLGRHWRRGFRLFCFRLALWLTTTVVVGGGLLALGVALGGWPPDGWSDGTLVALALVGIPVGIASFVLVRGILGFTTMFVVPVMLVEDRSVLSGWRRFWPTLTGEWKEYLAYLVVSVLLGIGVNVALGILVFITAVAVAIPLVLVGVVVAVSVGFEGIGAVVALLLVVLFILAMFVAVLVYQAPLQTFLRYYGLFVLGDTNEELDAVPEMRAAVRADGGPGNGPGSGTVDAGDGEGGPDGTDDGNDESWGDASAWDEDSTGDDSSWNDVGRSDDDTRE